MLHGLLLFDYDYASRAIESLTSGHLSRDYEIGIKVQSFSGSQRFAVGHHLGSRGHYCYLVQ